MGWAHGTGTVGSTVCSSVRAGKQKCGRLAGCLPPTEVTVRSCVAMSATRTKTPIRKDMKMATRTAKKTSAAKTPAKKTKTPARAAKSPRGAAAKTKAANQAKTTKNASQAKPAATDAKPQKKLSQINAAIEVLKQAKKPMTAKAMVEAMAAKGLWSSPGGKTPEATLYASIIRDIRRGADARFQKVDRGQFALAGK